MTLAHAVLVDRETSDQIRSRSCPRCYLCGALGEQLYAGLKDRLWGAPGTWNLKRCSDPRCGIIWLDPMPLEEDIGKAYESYFTHSDEVPTPYTSARHLVRAIKARYLSFEYGYTTGRAQSFDRILGLLAYLSPSRRAGLDFCVMYLPAVPGGRLLEIGCGNGSMLKGMADLGWQVEGIDFDPAAVQNCRRKGLKVNLGTLQSIQYGANQFDAITMSHLIEHVHDPLGLLQECRRILKPNGRISLVTPNIKSLGHRLYRSSWLHLDPPRHLHLFSVASLRVLLQKAGFRTTKIWTTVRDANRVFVASRSIKRKGAYRMGASHPRMAALSGEIMEVVGRGILKLSSEMGEELAVIAEKRDRV